MSVETLELAIEETQSELKKREPRRLIAWAAITLVIFFTPIVLFYQSASDSVFGSSYAMIVVVWLMIALGVGNVISAALFSARTVELKLAMATASSVLALLKTNGTASDSTE